MENKEFKKLVDSVKKDPSLLHALAFEPEKAAAKTDFISATSRTALEGMQAENLLAAALGLLEGAEGCACTTSSTCACTSTGGCHHTTQHRVAAEMAVNPAFNYSRFAGGFYNRFDPGSLGAGCGADATCSCTSGTCGGATCGGSTCSVTCSGDSCGNTCGDSCSNTSNYTFDPLERERLFARQLNRQLLWR